MTRRFTKKNFVVSLLVVFFLISLCQTGHAADIKLRVKTKIANIRENASPESKILSSAPMGAILTSNGKFGSWYRVVLPPDESGTVVMGFIHQNLVEVISEAPAVPERQERVVQPERKKVERVPVTQRAVAVGARETGLTGKGLKFGMNLANYTGESVSEFTEIPEGAVGDKAGGCFGFFLTYSLMRSFAIQPEVLVSMKGARGEGTILGEPFEFSVNMTYLEIPLLAKLLIQTGGKLKPNVYAGPALALKLSAKAVLKWAGQTEKEDVEDVKGTDFGLVFGGGFDYLVNLFGTANPQKLIMDVRFTYGLMSISEDEEVDVKNAVIALLLGLSF
ncbi:MAG: porin family protein [Candidatus Aminicenantes bacterium]